MLQTTESDIPAAFPALISPETVPSATGSEPAAAESFYIAFPAMLSGKQCVWKSIVIFYAAFSVFLYR